VEFHTGRYKYKHYELYLKPREYNFDNWEDRILNIPYNDLTPFKKLIRDYKLNELLDE